MAVALWQAVFELHFRAPPMLTNWKLRFQEFWESEVARFGENESVGFGAFCSNPNDNENPTSKTDAAGIPVSQHSMFTSWATVERKMQIAAHDPARTSMSFSLPSHPPHRILRYAILDTGILTSWLSG